MPFGISDAPAIFQPRKAELNTFLLKPQPPVPLSQNVAAQPGTELDPSETYHAKTPLSSKEFVPTFDKSEVCEQFELPAHIHLEVAERGVGSRLETLQ